MPPIEAYDWLRIFSIVVCFLLSLRMVWVAKMGWAEWNNKTRNHWWMEWGWVTFVGCLGSLDALLNNAGGGWRLLFIPMVVIFSVFAVMDNSEINVAKRIGYRDKRGKNRG